jgi:DNA primase small subunit
MPHSTSPASTPPAPTPTSEDELEQMEQDSPAKNRTQPDQTDAEITTAEVNALRLEEEPKKEVNLDDLFADVDSDDDEFSSAARPTQSQVPPTSSPGLDSSGSPEFVMPFSKPLFICPKTDRSSISDGVPVKASASDPEVLRSFYQRLFPWRNFFQWLNHSPTPTNDFAHREFAYTLANDAVWRYQSFPTADLYAP